MQLTLCVMIVLGIVCGGGLRLAWRQGRVSGRIAEGFHMVLALACVGLAWGVLSRTLTADPIPAEIGALWLASGLMAALGWAPSHDGGQDDGRRWIPVTTGLALGPAAMALMVSATAPPAAGGASGWVVASSLSLGLHVVVGVLMASAGGFVLRALSRLAEVDLDGPEGPSAAGFGFGPCGVLMGCGLAAALVWRQLISLGGGGSPWMASMPVVDSKGSQVLWLLDFDAGLPASLPAPELGGLVGAAALVCLLGGLLCKGRLAPFVALSGGGVLLAALVWILSRQGMAVTLEPETAKTALELAGAPAELIKSPRFQGQAPFALGLHGLLGAGATLASACLGAFALGWLTWRRGADPSRPTHPGDNGETLVLAQARLGARDAFGWAVVCCWLALATVMVRAFVVTGVWGPVQAGEHLMAGVALLMTALLFVLHGLGSSPRPGARTWRALCLALGGALVAGAASGGLAGYAGVFGA